MTGYIHAINKYMMVLVIVFFAIGSASGQDIADLEALAEQLSGDIAKTKMVPLTKVLNKLEADRHISFVYESGLMEGKQVPEKALKAPDLAGNLSGLLKEQGLAYHKQAQGMYVIRRLDNKPNTTTVAEQISGTVTDAQSGETLPGVNILVKGTSTGASTDADGQYELMVESLQDTLVVSFVGYKTQQVPINGRTEVDVALQTQAISGEEMVVVGYGTQEKAKLTSSISSVDMSQVEEKNVTTASQLLAGEAAGVSVQQASGIPGYDQAKIRIRGLGTFSSAGNDPLVLIDGISGSLNDVDPSNIQEISVLKDAAAASIYGARAANGVILVETKKGSEGKLQVSYRGYVGVQEATEIPEFVDSWIYAEAVNESRTNVGQSPLYSDEDIQKYTSGENRDEYPNKFHYKDLLNSGNGLQTKHNLTFSGGSSDTQYFVSGSYLRQNGLINEVTYDRYDLRTNINSALTDNLQVDLKLATRLLQNHEPSWNPKIHGGSGIMTRTIRLPNTIAGKRSDGTFGVLGTMAPEAALAAPSFFRRDLHGINSKVALTWDILNNLSLEGHVGYNYSSNREKRFASEMYINDNRTDDENNLTEYEQQDRYINIGSTVKYNEEFGNNDFEILGGFSQQINKNRYINANRAGFLSTETTELNAGDAARMKSFGSSTEWGLKSLFGRLNYSYQDKYLLSGSIRYDGSSRFPESNRFGFFPSFSAGWNIAKESFLQISWLDQLKLRGSWGQLGNQKIGLYPYQEVLEGGHNYKIGGSLSSGVALTNLPNRNIRWETTEITNAGVDVAVLDGKLSLSADYFYKQTSDILYSISVSDILGIEPSEQNYGIVENKGVEFDLSYSEDIGDFSFSIDPNISFLSNNVKNLYKVARDIDKGLFVGKPLQAIYGYKTDGLFVDEQDVNNWAEQKMDEAAPGKIRYKDINGDGIVDANDRTVIGSRLPTTTYGVGITAQYKNFDFYLQLEGAAGQESLPYSTYGYAFQNGGNVEKWQWENRWTPEDPSRNATYPRMQPYNGYAGRPSEFWLRSSAYLRIKNVQFAYTFSRLANFINVSKLKVYINARNLLTVDNFYQGWDPVMTTNQELRYPPTRLINAGININL